MFNRWSSTNISICPRTLRAWTDFAFVELGDIPDQEAPVREIELLAYDGTRLVDIRVADREFRIPRGYCYMYPGRYDTTMRFIGKDLSVLPIFIAN